jgi:ketosteroid isomerase-like protein
MKPHFVILFLAVLSLAAPIHAAPAQSVSSQNPSDSAQQVLRVLQEWSKDWKARDADSISALYAQDAVVYPAVDRRVSPGPDSIRDYFRQLFERLADPKIGDFVSSGPAQVSGYMAFDDGGIQYLVKGKCHPSDPGDGPCVLKGYYLTILRRYSDGRWLILRQSFSQIGLGSTIYKPR